MASERDAMITQERLRKILSYDPATGLWTWLISPNGNVKAGRVAGTLIKGYVTITIDEVRYLAHKLAWFWMTGEWPPRGIDHRDVSKSNNRWDNLRLATGTQNSANARARKSNRLGVKGVHHDGTKLRPYRAMIRYQRKLIAIGSFATVEEAAAAYARKALELFGEFARVA